MSFEVRVAGHPIAFDCAADEAILDAAERAGYALPYSCRKGICNTCEGSLLAGQMQVHGRQILGRALPWTQSPIAVSGASAAPDAASQACRALRSRPGASARS